VHDVVRVGCGFISSWIVALILTDSFDNTFSASESLNIKVPTTKCNVTCSKVLDKL
jgi:hypothetical protein